MADNEVRKILDRALADTWANIQYQNAPSRLRFPDGFRYCYWGRFELYSGIWAFCYSTTKNENGKFVSWAYQPVVGKKSWKSAKLLEHRHMKDAKARALKMYYQHQEVQDRAVAKLKARQRNDRRKKR